MTTRRGWQARPGCSVFGFCLALLASRGTRAADDDEARNFFLEYRTPRDCPDAAAFVAAIQARAPTARSVASDSAALRFRVEVSNDGVSTLWVDLPEGSSRRQFQAASCAEAVASMAVIASMVLEAPPAARLSSTETAGDAARESATESAPAPMPARPPVPATVPEPAARTLDRLVPTPTRATNAKPDQRSAPSWAVAVGGALETAVAPTPPLGLTVGIDASWNRLGWWSPDVRTELLATATTATRSPEGDATFRLVAARAYGCPVRLSISAQLRILPCIVLEGGSLRVAGGGAALNSRTASMPWLAGGVAIRGQLRVWRGVSFEGSAGLTSLARRDRFVFRSDVPIYHLPPESLGLALGLNVRLP